ncbi:MAG: hypothetical protein P8Y14_29740, partial [Anaerolineales bacterium]
IESKNPDRVVYNGKAVYPIIWGFNNRGKNILVCPLPYMHYVRNHTHVAFSSDYGPFLNKLTYSLTDFGLIMTVRISARWLRLTRKVTQKQIKNALLSNKAIYTVSPSLFSRPDYWDENLKVLGFHERNKTINWRPDKDLNDFLEKHKNNRILLITFGSMINPEPEEKTKIIIDVLERNKIPGIINTASGGLITTHLALKYGCATMIIPHIIDQFVWNKIVYDIGAGPEGVKVGKITTKNLEPKILELVNDRSFKKKANQVAGQMEKEDFREEIYTSII